MSQKTVSECMVRDVYAVGPETSLEVAARLFSSRHISGAPVIDADGKPVGVVTQNDLVDPDRRHSGAVGGGTYYTIRAGAVSPHDGGRIGGPGRVADIMTAFVVSVSPDTQVLKAAQLMAADGIHRVVVVDDGKIVGIVTSMDLVRGLIAAP